jgi:hypothetical protein
MEAKTEIGRIARNEQEQLIVSKGEFKGKEYVDIRVFYLDDKGEVRPTKKGITVLASLFPELLEVLKKVS